STADHDKTTDTFNVTINSDGTVTPITKVGDDSNTPVKEIVNKFHRSSLEITKTTDDGITPLTGIEFTIKDSENVQRGNGKTDEQGKITFTNLKVNETYTVSETTHNGYYPSEDYRFKPTENGTKYTLNWKNYPHSGVINITKTDSLRANFPLSDVTYDLYKSNGSDGYTLLRTSAATGANGQIHFDNMELNSTANAPNTAPTLSDTTYYLHEITSPTGYTLDTTYHPVTINASNNTGNISLTNA
ncbi:MAG: prealbumin-like fold domain-containing protein, partial [Oscillospiraceae bacterium]